MPYFHWVGKEADLANAEFTVLAQAVSPNDDGQLLWDVFFPRRSVRSVKISTLTSLVPKRWTSDRREWNARGRFIPQEFPGTEELEMVPIEDYFKLAEREMQDIEERLGDRADESGIREFLAEVGIDVDERITDLVTANYRRLEVDCFNAWVNGQVTARNPVTAATYTMAYGIDATRYQTAAPAWTGGAAGTAYSKFVTWLLDGYDRGMSIGGSMMRLATREAIRTSAPNLAFPLQTTVAPLLSDVERRIQDEIGADFRFYLNERTVDIFATGGLATTSTKLWPANMVAVVPVGESVGYSAFAPNVRAGRMSRAIPEARIDRNGQVVYFESAGAGRELTCEVQVNALPILDAARIWVINAGI